MAPVMVVNLGRMNYQRSFTIQEAFKRVLLNDIQSGKRQRTDALLLVEHEPVYTIGFRSKEYNPSLEDKLRSLGADFHQVHRGGLITFHGPGQLVVYPIINLKNYGFGVRSYVEKLESTVIRTCAEFGIGAGTTSHTGVWVESDRKIAAIGVNARRYVTTHGLALNCNTDLSWFSHIAPCGLEGKSVTSLSRETGRDISVTETIHHFLDSFKTIFNCKFIP